MSADLVAFLRERIAEDRRTIESEREFRSEANVALRGATVVVPPMMWPGEMGDLDRCVVECDARERILNWYEVTEVVDPTTSPDVALIRSAWLDALRVLTLPFAGHPDYREEFRP